jgi:hypothetical protein
VKVFIDLIGRLTSRKLWLAVAAFIVFVANGQYTEAVAVVVAYLAAEGAADAAGRLKA